MAERNDPLDSDVAALMEGFESFLPWYLQNLIKQLARTFHSPPAALTFSLSAQPPLHAGFIGPSSFARP
jgi:hypothetical protein